MISNVILSTKQTPIFVTNKYEFISSEYGGGRNIKLWVSIPQACNKQHLEINGIPNLMRFVKNTCHYEILIKVVY